MSATTIAVAVIQETVPGCAPSDRPLESGVVTKLTLPPIRAALQGVKTLKFKPFLSVFRNLNGLTVQIATRSTQFPLQESHMASDRTRPGAFRLSRRLRSVVFSSAGDVAAISSWTKASLAIAAGPSTNG